MCVCVWYVMYLVSQKFTTSTSNQHTTPGPAGTMGSVDRTPEPMRGPANSRRPWESRAEKHSMVAVENSH